ncbi:Channel-tunnel spanning the outer membrane and periplasm segregation of daughter chromosomes [uncultured Candidatus Thioglobus sp.]|nr:Channel-tunnel spanning the outer membrane and periplasm segregation of daughter chromosomes [uncultured Candidatus Thioglobus sp.]
MMNISVMTLLFLLSINVLALSEQGIIQKILDHHKLFESNEIDMFIQQQRLQSKEDSYYGWHLDLTAKYGLEKDSTDKDTGYTYTKNQTKTARNIGLKLSTAFKNGTSFNIGFDRKLPVDDQEKYKDSSLYTDQNLSEHDNILTTKFNIPLLKNSGGGENKKLYDIAEIDQKIEALKLLENKEDEVEDALIAFIDLAMNIRRLQIYKDRLSALEGLKEHTKNSKNDSRLLTEKIQKTQTEKSKSKSNLEVSILTLKNFIDFDKNDLSAINFNPDVRSILIKNSQKYLRKYSRDFQINKLDIDKKQHYIDSYKDKSLPDFDVNLSHVKTQNKGNYSSYSYKNSNEYKFSIDLSYPLSGDPVNDHNLFKSELEKRKKLTDYEADLKDKILDIRVLSNELASENRTLESYYQIKLKQRNTTELDSYLAGSGNIRFVLDEIYEHYQIQSDYADALTNYHQKRIQYDNFLDRLIVNDRCYFCENYK